MERARAIFKGQAERFYLPQGEGLNQAAVQEEKGSCPQDSSLFSMECSPEYKPSGKLLISLYCRELPHRA